MAAQEGFELRPVKSNRSLTGAKISSNESLLVTNRSRAKVLAKNGNQKRPTRDWPE